MNRPSTGLAVLLATALATGAASAAKSPAMDADTTILAGAYGAIAASTCTGTDAAMHRAKARDAVRRDLQARGAAPADLDARYDRAYEKASKRMAGVKPAERQAICARMAQQGVLIKPAPKR